MNDDITPQRLQDLAHQCIEIANRSSARTAALYYIAAEVITLYLSGKLTEDMADQCGNLMVALMSLNKEMP